MRILHPTDFSAPAGEAEQFAVRLLRQLGGELLVIHVMAQFPLYGEGLFNMADSQRFYDMQRKWADETLEARVAALRERGIAARPVVAVGPPAAEIVRLAADERVELIVMGTHGRSGLNRVLVGSVADRVVRLAPCPVLTVRGTPSRQPAAA